MPNVDGVLLGPGPLAIAVTKPYSNTYLWENGNYCTHDGKIYKFIGEDLIEGEAWTAAHWSEIKLTDAIINLQEQIDAMDPESATGVFLDVDFTINSNQWTENNGIYTYNLSNALIKASSGVAVYYDNSFRTALSGDVSIHKYTGYVTFTTDGQPQGALSGTLRIIQSVGGILPVAKGGTGAATAKGARRNLNTPIKPIELPFGTVSSLPQTVYDADITEDMVPIKWVFSNPAACPKGLTLTLNGTGTPSATISIEGTQTFSGETTVTIYIEDKKTRDDDAAAQQQEQYVGDFVQVGAQTLTVQQKTQARVNIEAASTSDVGTLSGLSTTEKDSLVGAVNEVNSKLTSKLLTYGTDYSYTQSSNVDTNKTVVVRMYKVSESLYAMFLGLSFTGTVNSKKRLELFTNVSITGKTILEGSYYGCLVYDSINDYQIGAVSADRNGVISYLNPSSSNQTDLRINVTLLFITD